MLVIALISAVLGAVSLAGRVARVPLPVDRTITACGGIVTTIVLIFLDTRGTEVGVLLGLLASIAILAGGLLLGRSAATTPPGWYPDPQGEARLRYWDGSGWTGQTSA